VNGYKFFKRVSPPGSAEYQFAGRSYFYIESARPKGILFSVVGVVGLCATWIFGDWPATIVLTILFGAFLVFGLPAVVTGGRYGSWFADGVIHWQYPNRFYGKSDSCRISDLAEFQVLVPPPFSGPDGPDVSYRFLLKDGTTKSIDVSCFGRFDEALTRALQQENSTIVLTRLQRVRGGWKRTQ
jgi:hypothetical protein